MAPSPDDFARAVAGATAAAAGNANGSLSVALEPRAATCPEHGPYTSTGTRYLVGRGREVWTPCPACAEQRRADEQEAAEQARRERERIRLEEQLGRAAIPACFIGRTCATYRAETPEQVHALTAARDYAENFERHLRTGESLMLLGRRGTGKSHLAAAILQALMPAHCGLYTTATDVILMIRETWQRGAERTQRQVMSMLANVPLLVIDEVGVQYGTESEQNILFQVLDHRYRDKRPFILMANLKASEVEPLLGERTYDRLREVSRVVVFEWDSYRAQARRDAARIEEGV